MSDPLNLSGKWDGTFSYSHSDWHCAPFLAEIAEEAGVFSGSTIEPEIHKGISISAKLEGHRSGRAVDFVKVYINPSMGYENPVDYVGQLSEDGLTITGVWSLLDMDGTFEMTREAQAEIAQEAVAQAEI